MLFCSTNSVATGVNAGYIEVSLIQFVEFDVIGELIVTNTDNAYANVSLTNRDTFKNEIN